MKFETISLDQAIDRLYQCLTKDPSEIARIVGAVLSIEVAEDYVCHRIDVVYPAAQAQLAVLQRDPGITQRTDAWYAARGTLITASDFAQACNRGKFGTQKAWYAKKTGWDDAPFDPYCPPLLFGTMMEPCAQAIYSLQNNVRVHEFGLLRHPTIPHVGASPDGITDNGVLVEFKVPWRRKIDGTISTQYLEQCQGQMSVCGLQECDFHETKVEMVPTWEELIETVESRPHKTYYGWVIQRRPPNTTSPKFTYSPVGWAGGGKRADPAQVPAPPEVNPAVDGLGPFVEYHHWYCAFTNTLRLHRDDEHLDRIFGELDKVWAKVQAYKEDRELYNREVNIKKERKDSQPITGYSFLEVT
jgi:putative phage-type endonuclease